MRRAAASILCLGLVVGACGQSTVKPDGAAQTVVDAVSRKTGFTPTDVSCPSGVEAKVGVTFDCHFTGPEGPYTASMRITAVEGERVVFAIDSHRSG